ncbi:acyltransferase family protein [Pseudomonas sp. ZT5P21]
MGSIGYRTDIQGLRAIAVLAVIFFHFNPAWLSGGFVGVDVFLVISGFLIVSILLHKKAQPDYQLIRTLRYFYGSRLKRIAPAYFVMLVLVSLMVSVLFLPQDLDVYKKSLSKAAYFNSNDYFAGFGDYFAPVNREQPLLHTWSLAVEIQFYLLVPMLVLVVPTKALKWLLATLLIGFTAIADYRLRILGIEQATYYSLYARLPEFFAGGLVAVYVYTIGWGNKPWLNALGLSLIVFAAITQPHLGHFPGLPALLPVIATALILMHPAQGFSRRLLASPIMVRLGELSYSLYLWHWPVLALLRYYTGVEVLSLPFSLLFFALTFVLSVMSYYWVETPLRAQRAHIKQALAYCFLALVMLAAVKGISKLNEVVSPTQLPIEYQRYADPSTICHGQIVGDCLKGDLNSQKEVLVLGDSHAAMLNNFFDPLGKELGFKARIITASSCVTIPNFDYNRIDEWSRSSCLAQIERARIPIRDASVIFLAASWSWQFESLEFQRALSEFLQEQTQAGKKIYLMAQEPRLAQNPLRALRFRDIGLPFNVGIDNSYLNANIRLKGYAEKYKGVTYLNFERSGFFTIAPFFNGELIYLDEHHLNKIGAEKYSEAARNEFKRIME